MEEATLSFEQMQNDFAFLYFSDKDGVLNANAMPHLARLTRSMLLPMYWLSRLDISHGDIKPGNMVLVDGSR